jgi:Cysteine-rich secretory protein family
MRVFGFLLNLSLAVVVALALALVPGVGCGDDDDRLPGECGDGPLSTPIVPCQPTPVPDTGDPYADCVARINQFRADCQCLPPLERWTDGESCADEHAQYDSEQNSAHAGFVDNICDPRGSAQNECPGWGSEAQIISGCLQMMWDEGPGEPFSEHGHYINMSNTSYNRVACGFYTTPSGSIWAVQNFSP